MPRLVKGDKWFLGWMMAGLQVEYYERGPP
jgi:hypothetical protein